MIRHALALTAAALLVGTAAEASAAHAVPTPTEGTKETALGPTLRPDTTSFTVTHVMIPVGEELQLHGRLYRPDPVERARPTIFSLTPYTVDDAHEYGRYFAQRGYAYLNVDVRGRGASEGAFQPFGPHDGPDGAAVVRWIAEQPWSDGQVAMRGGSYRGTSQWQVLAENPEPLATVTPSSASYLGWSFPYRKGVFVSGAAWWLSLVHGRGLHRAHATDSDYWQEIFRGLHRSGRAFAALDEISGLSLEPSEFFDRWIEHPRLDDYWRRFSPDSADYESIDRPILSITGYFDGSQSGTLRYYRKHMRHGSEAGTERHYLLMGPWSHGGTRDPSAELGGLTFADTAAIDMNALHHQWFDWVMRDGSKPEMLEARVVYYVMGEGRWRTASSLEEVADTSRTLYLQSPDTNPDDPFDAGRLNRQAPERADTDQYVYDPRDTADIATLETMENDYTAPGAAFLEGPKLVYHSAPVEQSFELSGQMQLDAWIELDVPDTDIAVWVYEIQPTGKTIYLGETHLRARHRLGVDTVALAEPGRVQQYRFDRFLWTSRRIHEGSRLRLVIAPLNDPAWQKNYNSGGPPMQESVEDAQTATVRLHLGPDRPSKLVLPVRSDGGS